MQQRLLFLVIRFVTDEAGGKSGETSVWNILPETGELGTRNYHKNLPPPEGPQRARTFPAGIFKLSFSNTTCATQRKKKRKGFQKAAHKSHFRWTWIMNKPKAFSIFVLRKKGSKTKKRTEEEDIEKGNCGPPTQKVFLKYCRTWIKRYLINLQTRVIRDSRIHHRTTLKTKAAEGPGFVF